MHEWPVSLCSLNRRTRVAAAWRDVIPLMVSGSVKPIVERVYRFDKAGEALRHLIEDRPFGKVVLAD
ncbi:zinc-binding dehydrogenase [Bradyrhizobium erythrophlei]|uniref:zinc-binding dehydrogenase n=1 Tax=Bradyrhizobium erythrophlei TaxID=1437360 RepID=UPI001FCD9C60|nr:zinc-binding dehydrogenase [Bradyrhizobium erythrophlei]